MEKVTKPYRSFMKFFDDIKHPSLSLDSDDVTEESVYRVADELLKSHIYSAKTALPFMTHKKLILWIDYDFFALKKIAQKVSCERVEMSDEGINGEKKTRKYHFHVVDNEAFALSPAFQAFVFVGDDGISKFGLSLKMKRFSFLQERELRYLELETIEEPFNSVDLEFFRRSAMVSPDEYRKRHRQMETNDAK